jgi:hypothetical protein
MSNAANPFQQDMVRMVIPDHMSTSISVAGFSLEADEHRVVTVPKHLVGTLRSHGLAVDDSVERVQAESQSDAPRASRRK